MSTGQGNWLNNTLVQGNWVGFLNFIKKNKHIMVQNYVPVNLINDPVLLAAVPALAVGNVL